MKTLMIKDLSVTAELDRKAMAAVQGGTGKGMGGYGDYSSYLPKTPSYDWGDMAKSSSFNFNAAQSLGQSQNTLVNNGNNVAFASGITSTVTPHQTGSNNINFG